MQSARDYGNKFGEAFKLMLYSCKCGYEEPIWNSRDGVTPFCTKCPSCKQLTLQHVNWQDDCYEPDYKLRPGQRFWRDGTPDEAETIMRKRIFQMKEKYPLSEDAEKALILRCRNGDEGEFQKGWPMLDQKTIELDWVEDVNNACVLNADYGPLHFILESKVKFEDPTNGYQIYLWLAFAKERPPNGELWNQAGTFTTFEEARNEVNVMCSMFASVLGDKG